jgi:hypothetical protein
MFLCISWIESTHVKETTMNCFLIASERIVRKRVLDLNQNPVKSMCIYVLRNGRIGSNRENLIDAHSISTIMHRLFLLFGF